MEFFDSPTFGTTWMGRFIQIGKGVVGRTDMTGKEMSLPKGAIGYVDKALPGTIFVDFGKDLLKPPRPRPFGFPIENSREYQYRAIFSVEDWYNLDIRLSK
jgi:hypothetical protein